MDAKKRISTPDQPASSLESPAPKKSKAGAGTPPVSAGSDTPASGAVTVKNKKGKHPIFDQYFDENGNPRILMPSSAEKDRLAREASTRAKEYVRTAARVPFVLKLGSLGQVTVEKLGELFVEPRSRVPPAFHNSSCIFPLGYRALYIDPVTKVKYQCEIVDGMETALKMDAPVFTIDMLTSTPNKIVDISPDAAWKAARDWQIVNGNPLERETASKWELSTLGSRFALQEVEVRKRLESLAGATSCFDYNFLPKEAYEGSGKMSSDPLKRKEPQGGVGSKKKAKTDASSGAKSQAAKVDATGKKNVSALVAYNIFHAEVKNKVKAELAQSAEAHPPGYLNKIIAKQWAELPDTARKNYFVQAEAQAEAKALAQQPSSAPETAVQEPTPADEAPPEDEPASVPYRTEGPYIGQRARRFIYNDKEQATDVADGVIIGYLPVEDQGDDIYISEETNQPAALWQLQFDDTTFGIEDLEEHEVKESMEILKEPLNEKLQQKHEKRLERIAAKKAKIAEKQAEKDRLRQEKEAEKEKLRLERLEKEKLRKAKEKPKVQLTDKVQDGLSVVEPSQASHVQQQPSSRSIDEALLKITSGPFAGREAGSVPFPKASNVDFPTSACAAEFLALYVFLRDLSGDLGAARISFEELRECVTEKDGSEGFCELALWLTKLAVRVKYIREEDDAVEYEVSMERFQDMLLDLKLSPGPLLCPTMKDPDSVRYSCWHLVNESSWPEIVRLLIKSCPMSENYMSLLDALEQSDPKDFTSDVRLGLLAFLRDETCSCDKVRKILNGKVREAERTQERKRVEDAALRKSREILKVKPKADGGLSAASNASANQPDSAATTTDESGSKGRVLGAAEVMKLLYELDPQPFELRFQGQKYKGTLDTRATLPSIKSGGETFLSPNQWICHVHKKEKVVGVAAKAVIYYKGKSLRECEQELSLQKTAGDDVAAATAAEDDTSIQVDVERRKREFESALLRAEKGLRFDALGCDRNFRRYWHFEGVNDRVWVSISKDPVDGTATELPAAVDYGYDGRASTGFIAQGCRAEELWCSFSLQDGTLKDLHDYLLQGPRGAREAPLLELWQRHGIKSVADVVEDQPAEAAPKASEEQVSEDTEGYHWQQLPHVGDVVWARKGSDPKTALWRPVQIVDPPESAVSDSKVNDTDESDDEEWQRDGSEYIGKRVQLTIHDDRKGKDVLENGRIIGWLPVELADFKSEKTGESAALWRVKLNDKEFSSQDLEEYEVKEAIKNYIKAEALKKSKEAEYLSRKSMFGQSIKWLYCQSFDDDRSVECLSIKDVLPYAEFRDQRLQGMRRTDKVKLLYQVERANQYLEEHSSSQDKEEDLKEILRELGLPSKPSQNSNPQFQAACRHCMRHPRIMNIVQSDHGDSSEVHFLSSVRILRHQLLTIFGKFQIDYFDDDDVEKRLKVWKDRSEQVEDFAQLKAMLLELESIVAEVDITKSAVVDLQDWRSEGHEWIGKRLRRVVEAESEHAVTYLNARVVGWLDADRSDFLDKEKNPAALWRVIREDGQEEDLEEYEVKDCMRDLVETGEKGAWHSPQDRSLWLEYVGKAQTLGALSLAMYLFGDRALHFVSTLGIARFGDEPEWDDYCYISGEGGTLMCCETCPRTALPASFGYNRAPKDDFYCAYCVRDHRPSAKARSAQPSKDPEPVAERPRGGGGGGGGSGSRQASEKSFNRQKKNSSKSAGSHAEMVEKLRRSIAKNGLQDGSVCEIQPDARAQRREERWFVKVVDGYVDKCKEEPAIRAGHYFSEWAPREAKRMRLIDNKIAPIPISSILQSGSLAELLDGNQRLGYLPVDATL